MGGGVELAVVVGRVAGQAEPSVVASETVVVAAGKTAEGQVVGVGPLQTCLIATPIAPQVVAQFAGGTAGCRVAGVAGRRTGSSSRTHALKVAHTRQTPRRG